MDVPENIKVKSLYKAVSILDYFTDEHPKRRITELAELAGIPKSAVYNILSTFEYCGFIEKDEVSSQYMLGRKFLEMGYRVNKVYSLSRGMHQLLQELAEKTGETAFYAQRYGFKIMYRDVAYPSTQVNTQSIVGWTASMHCSALGKMLLSFEPSVFVDELCEKEGLKKYTDTTITTPDALKKELKLIRERGYSIDNMEQEYGFKCVACPVYDINGNVIAAVSVSGSALRFQENDILRYVKYLKKTATELIYV